MKPLIFYAIIMVTIFFSALGNPTLGASRDVELQAQVFKTSKNVAIVIGIEQYDEASSGISKLDYAAEDAIAITQVLQKNRYTVKRLLNHQAGKHQILSQIAEAGKLVDKANGTLFFSFSGHGFAQNKINYLVVNGSTTSNLQQSALRVDEVILALRRTGAKRIVIFIDACRNVPGSKALNGGFVSQQAGAGVQILVSTKAGELSWESPKLQKGVFSHFLVEGLQGAAARANNIVEFTDLAHYVEAKVKDWSFRNLNRIQQPYHYASGELYGRFVLTTERTRVNHRIAVNNQQAANVGKSQTAAASVDIRQTTGRFRDNGNGTIFDSKMNLTWKKCVEGTSGNNCEQGIETALKWQDALTYRQKGWCLPSKDALASLYNARSHSFPNTPKTNLWTSTNYAGDSYNAWMINFGTGNSSIQGKSSRNHVRLVRCS